MPKFESLNDTIDSLCLRSNDILRRNKGLYLDCATDVFYDLNLTTVKIAKRELFKINKRTNTIDLPNNCLQVSSVSVIDHHGVIWPVFRNDRLHKDIVEVSAKKNCACENECGYSLCNLIKGYEAITSVKSDTLPNGTPISFTCVDRKGLGKNGIFYSETQYPFRVYNNGVWTGTILKTETQELCALELDSNGCIVDSESNEKSIFRACGIINTDRIPFGGDANSFYGDKQVDTWRYWAASQLEFFSIQCGSYDHCRRWYNNIYNIEEGGSKLIFPHNFGFDKALVRFFSDVDLDDMQIPIVAKQTFMTGLQYFSLENNEKKIQQAAIFAQKYSRQKWGLLMELNKYTIDEMRMMTTPPVYIPSYIDHRHDRSWNIE